MHDMNKLIELVEKASVDMSLEDILHLQLYALELWEYSDNVRESTIDDCVNRLGGRYGAAATKDLQSLKGQK